MSNQVQVHEFCRAFDNVKYSDKYKVWVSGGYSPKKIANYDIEVPSVIQKAVREGYFSINDNFSPENERCSVIARELSTNEGDGKIYSILAIANRQIDDAGRPTIGYKYFWTDAHDSELDGIVQLLIFWYKNEYVSFEMQELDVSHQSRKVNLSSNVSVFPKDRTQKIVMETISHLIDSEVEYNQYFLHMSKAIKYLDTGKYDDIPSEVDFYKTHCVALYISRQLKNDNIFSFCSWAFYITPVHLLYPTSFACINDKDGFFCINNNVQELLIETSTQSSLTILPESSINGKTIPVHIEENIKKTLIDTNKIFASKNHRGTEVLTLENFFQYLIDYKNANWSDCIDDVMIKRNNLSYNAIIYLVGSDTKYKERWLEDFFASLEIPTFLNKHFLNLFRKKQGFGIILDVHTKLMESAYRYQKARRILTEPFFFGIAWLLKNKCLENESKIDQRKLQYLLLESKSIWSEIFSFFADQVVNELGGRYHNEKTVVSEHVKWFCQSIYDDIRPSNNPKQNSEHILFKYQRLDRFFERKISEIIYSKYYQNREKKNRMNNHSNAIMQNEQFSDYIDKGSLNISSRLVFALVLLVILVTFILFSINIYDDKNINYEKGECEFNSIKNLEVFKKCYGQNETTRLVFNDIDKELFPKPELRKDSDGLPFYAAEYLKKGLNEDDYKKRKSKVKECSMKSGDLNQCLNGTSKKP
jgi:hypothetical protein